jgi:hypothetical protein
MNHTDMDECTINRESHILELIASSHAECGECQSASNAGGVARTPQCEIVRREVSK